jgi:ERCC4-type nuclease
MRIIVDTREHDLYEKLDSIIHFEGHSTSLQLVKKVLDLGDILIQTDDDKDVMLIERKTLGDLLSSIKDGRYKEQSYRLIHSSGFPPHAIVYMIEGMMSQLRTVIDKKTVYSAMGSLNYFKGFSVFRTCSLYESAETIVWISQKIERDLQQGVLPFYLQKPIRELQTSETAIVNDSQIENTVVPSGEPEQPVPQQTPADYCSVVKKVKKDNITVENIGQILLCQIPGISSVTSGAIMKEYNTFANLIDQIRVKPENLYNIHIENNGKMRKISKSCAESIIKYLST